MTILRASGALLLTVALAACGGGDVSVRNGPQAVHPSPSALAQGGTVNAGQPAAAAPAAASAQQLDVGVAAFRDVCLNNAPDFAGSKAAAASYGVGNFFDLGGAQLGTSSNPNLSVQVTPGVKCVVTTPSRGNADPASQFAGIIPGGAGKSFPFATKIGGQSFIIQHDRNGGEAFVMLKR